MPIAFVPALAEAGTKPIAARLSASRAQTANFRARVLIDWILQPGPAAIGARCTQEAGDPRPKTDPIWRISRNQGSNPTRPGRGNRMQYHGEASDPHRNGFEHSALIYGSDDAFLETALPFVEAGMATAEPTLVAVQGRNIESLRAAMGGEPVGVTLLSVEERYESSARTRDKFVRWAGERSGSGRTRLI